MAQATVKLYASLGDYLPSSAVQNTTTVALPEAATIGSMLEEMRVPKERCHLVLLNGEFVPPSARIDRPVLDGDTVAVWPPVAGG